MVFIALLIQCSFVVSQFGAKEGAQAVLKNGKDTGASEQALFQRYIKLNAKVISLGERLTRFDSEATPTPAGKAESRLVLTVSVGDRGHFEINHELMRLYATRCNAELEVVSTLQHPVFTNKDASQYLPKDRLGKCGDDAKCITEVKSRFGKLAALTYYLKRYDRVLFLDDSCVVSPFAGNVFETVAVGAVGAVLEPHTSTWALPFIEEQCRKYEVSQWLQVQQLAQIHTIH